MSVVEDNPYLLLDPARDLIVENTRIQRVLRKVRADKFSSKDGRLVFRLQDLNRNYVPGLVGADADDWNP